MGNSIATNSEQVCSFLLMLKLSQISVMYSPKIKNETLLDMVDLHTSLRQYRFRIWFDNWWPKAITLRSVDPSPTNSLGSTCKYIFSRGKFIVILKIQLSNIYVRLNCLWELLGIPINNVVVSGSIFVSGCAFGKSINPFWDGSNWKWDMNRQNICLRGWYDNDDTISVWVKKIHSYWYQPMWHMINSEMHIQCAFKYLSVLWWSWNIRVDSVCLKSVWSRKHFHRTFILEMIWIVCSWWYFNYRQTKQNYNVFHHWQNGYEMINGNSLDLCIIGDQNSLHKGPVMWKPPCHHNGIPVPVPWHLARCSHMYWLNVLLHLSIWCHV